MLPDLAFSRTLRFRDGDAQCLGGLEVDDELDFCDLLHGQIGRFLAFENAPG